jgi:outer membrane protein W
MGLILATRADVLRVVAILWTLLAAMPALAQKHVQRRVEVILDGEGVRRTGTTTIEPNQVTYIPRFDTGGGAGLGIVWFVSGRMAFEVKAAALASQLTVRTAGADYVLVGDLGYAQIYPLSVLLQWHPIDGGSFRPYLGIGGAYVILRDVEKSSGGVTGVAFDDPAGLVVNAGLRIPFSSRWSLNGDVRYVPVETRGRARFEGTRSSAEIHVRPLIVSAGMVYRF